MDTGIGRGGGNRRAGTGPEPEDVQDAPRGPRLADPGAAGARLALLARAVAHELNNMLMVVHGSAETLRDAAAAGQPADREVLDDLVGACDRVGALARRLQAFGHRHGAPRGPGALATLDDLLRDG